MNGMKYLSEFYSCNLFALMRCLAAESAHISGGINMFFCAIWLLSVDGKRWQFIRLIFIL